MLQFLSWPWGPGGAAGPQDSPRSPGLQAWMAVSPWWPLPPWAASAGKHQNGLYTVRSQKMKALTAERCWKTQSLALLVRGGQPPLQGSAGKSHLSRLAQRLHCFPPGLTELVASCSEAQELRRRKASCQLGARLIFSLEDQTTALVIPDLAVFELRLLWQ